VYLSQELISVSITLPGILYNQEHHFHLRLLGATSPWSLRHLIHDNDQLNWAAWNEETHNHQDYYFSGETSMDGNFTVLSNIHV